MLRGVPRNGRVGGPLYRRRKSSANFTVSAIATGNSADLTFIIIP
jgi:hypothetical protein